MSPTGFADCANRFSFGDRESLRVSDQPYRV